VAERPLLAVAGVSETIGLLLEAPDEGLHLVEVAVVGDQGASLVDDLLGERAQVAAPVVGREQVRVEPPPASADVDEVRLEVRDEVERGVLRAPEPLVLIPGAR
jgi:hypothetical protein